MARTAKNEKALTPEEKLAQALVPDVEQPYRVPENWCWVWHNSILDISGGSQPDKSLFIPEPKAGYTQLYQTRDYGEHPIPVFIPDKYATKTTVEGDILLARYGGSLGKVFKARAGAYNVALAKVITLRKGAINNELLFYYYLSHFYQDFCVKAAYGRSAQAGFNRDDLAGLMFPLPPLAEQQRIVDRIESLFAKLDEAKEKAQAVVDGFEDRRAAILHKAFTGELTAAWRKENGYSIESWKNTILQKVLDVRDGTHDSPKYYDEGFPLVTSKNLKNGKITDKDLKLISKEDYEKINERSKVDVGDILFAMIGTIGNPVVVEEEPGFAIKNVALFKNIGEISPYYVRYYLESKTVIDKMEKEAKGSTQRFVALGYLRSFPIKKPPEPEQRLIVKLVDQLLGAEIQAKEAAEQVIEQIDAMKKSILARAFRGELGTNDPADESAVELLKKTFII